MILESLGGLSMIVGSNIIVKVAVQIVGGILTNEVAFACSNGVGSSSKLVAFGLTILEKRLDLLILHLILDGPEQDSSFVGSADLDVLGELDHSLDKLRVDRLVDVDTLCSNAHLGDCQQERLGDTRMATNLSRIEEATHCHLWNGLVHVYIRKDDARIVTTKLKSNTLQ
jgi:hypothetical protein